MRICILSLEHSRTLVRTLGLNTSVRSLHSDTNRCTCPRCSPAPRSPPSPLHETEIGEPTTLLSPHSISKVQAHEASKQTDIDVERDHTPPPLPPRVYPGDEGESCLDALRER